MICRVALQLECRDFLEIEKRQGVGNRDDREDSRVGVIDKRVCVCFGVLLGTELCWDFFIPIVQCSHHRVTSLDLTAGKLVWVAWAHRLASPGFCFGVGSGVVVAKNSVGRKNVYGNTTARTLEIDTLASKGPLLQKAAKCTAAHG